jgi:hypothetical protein
MKKEIKDTWVYINPSYLFRSALLFKGYEVDSVSPKGFCNLKNNGFSIK